MTDPNGSITQREFAAWVAAHDHVHAMDRAQLEKTERTLDKRLDAMNEFRQSLRDAQGTFVTRDMADIRHGAIESKIEALEELIDKQERWQAGIDGRTIGAAAAISLIVTLVSLGLAVLLKVIP